MGSERPPAAHRMWPAPQPTSRKVYNRTLSNSFQSSGLVYSYSELTFPPHPVAHGEVWLPQEGMGQQGRRHCRGRENCTRNLSVHSLPPRAQMLQRTKLQTSLNTSIIQVGCICQFGVMYGPRINQHAVWGVENQTRQNYFSHLHNISWLSSKYIACLTNGNRKNMLLMDFNRTVRYVLLLPFFTRPLKQQSDNTV